MKQPAARVALLGASLLVWLAFVDSDHTAGATNVEPSQKAVRPSVPRQAVLIPARPAPTEASLRVHLSEGRPAATPDDEAVLGLIVTDPQGRRSGIDARNQAIYQEIPGSNVERVALSARTGHGASAIVVSIKPAIATMFSLEINAIRAGDYRLAVNGVSPTLQSITEMSGGHVALDTSVHYRIDLTKVRSLPLHGRPGITGTVVDPADRFVSQPEERMILPSDAVALAAAAAVARDPCGYFFDALKVMPHEKLTRNDGRIKSLWDGETYSGCAVTFVTNDALRSGREIPNFTAFEGTALYRLGWRMNSSILADGPGTGIFGIENRMVLCVVSTDQPAYMEEKTNEIIQSETLTIAVQCWQK